MRLCRRPARQVAAERASVRLAFQPGVELREPQDVLSIDVRVRCVCERDVAGDLAAVRTVLVVGFGEDFASDKKISLHHNNKMLAIVVGAGLIALLLYTNLDFTRSEDLVHASANGWYSVASVIDGSEYDRKSSNINDAGDCRKKCSAAKCRAVRFEQDYLKSGRNICLLYDSFSGAIQSHKMPTDDTTSTWVKQ
jgi:hypothetical protein